MRVNQTPTNILLKKDFVPETQLCTSIVKIMSALRCQVGVVIKAFFKIQCCNQAIFSQVTSSHRSSLLKLNHKSFLLKSSSNSKLRKSSQVNDVKSQVTFAQVKSQVIFAQVKSQVTFAQVK